MMFGIHQERTVLMRSQVAPLAKQLYRFRGIQPEVRVD